MDKHKDYIENIEGAERRFITFEARAEDEGRVEGIASKVGETYDLGWFEERVEPGAFDNVMKDDVRILFNHDPNQIVARTSAGTGEIYLTDEGHLGYRYSTPNTSIGKDLEENIRLGNVNQSSFAFVVKEDEWRSGEEKELRVIKKVERLYDVSPVTYPASPSTTVAKRSLEARKEEEKPNADKTTEQEVKYEYKRINNYKRKAKIINKKKS